MGSIHTMASWARKVQSSADVPPLFARALETSEEKLSLALFLPACSGWRGRAADRLLALSNKGVHTWEELPEGALGEARFPFDEIRSVEAGTVLLSSWIGFETATKLFTLDFNTVDMSLFEIFVEELRAQGGDDEGEGMGYDVRQLPSHKRLAREEMLFLSLAARYLHPRARVRADLFQPERGDCPAHYSLLTEKELVYFRRMTLREDANPYGGAASFLPWRYFQKAEREETGDGVALSIAHGSMLPKRLLFGNDNPDLDLFLAALKI